MSRYSKIFLSSISVVILLVTAGLQKNSRETLNAEPAKTAEAIVIEEDVQAKVDKYINVCLKFDLFGSSGPGFSVLIAEKGRILAKKGYGFANCEHDIPNTPQTKFRLGSISKQFTAMAIMQLQEKGLLKITDTINKYIPDYPQGNKITIHHLLTHTSGIYPFFRRHNYEIYKSLPSSLEGVIDKFKNKPPEFPPGDGWSYCSPGYIILSYVIEKVSGQPYEEFVKKNIFDVIGMKNTGYDHHEQIIKKMAAGYSSDSEGNDLINGPYIDPSTLFGSGALYSTVEDMYIWDGALHTNKLVNLDSIKKIFTPYRRHYSYGWVVGKENGKNVTFHRGTVAGFTGYFLRYPDAEVCIIVLSNFEFAPVIKISKELSEIAFGKDVNSVIAEHILGKDIFEPSDDALPLGIRFHR